MASENAAKGGRAESMTRQFAVTVPGGTIVGWEQGDGPHVLLLHGGPGVSDYTESLAAELEDGYTVTRYQQRGVAPSTIEGPFDVESHMADAIAVMDGARIDKAYLLGHSWGGYLALHLAAAHHDRFAGLVPIDPLGGIGPDGGVEEMAAIMDARIGPEQAARAAALDARAASPGGSPEDAEAAMAITWAGYFASPDKVLPMPPLRVSSACNNATFESIFEHFEAGTLVRRLRDVQLPAVFVLGADSPLQPRHSIATAALMPNAAYRVEDAGHMVWMERPGAVRRALDSLADAEPQRATGDGPAARANPRAGAEAQPWALATVHYAVERPTPHAA
jgi:pimeloyl-ACP methyl ester carboxylesterase